MLFIIPTYKMVFTGKLLKNSKAYDDLGVVAYELTAPIIEKLHGFIDDVKNNPVMPDSLFTLFTNSFNMNTSEIVKFDLSYLSIWGI